MLRDKKLIIIKGKKKLSRFKAVIYWLPRVLAILFNVFLSLFALDVFEGRDWFIALLVHLVPNYILAGVTLIAWRREFVGGILFFVLAGVGIYFFSLIILFVPLIVIGVLFMVSFYMRSRKVFEKPRYIQAD